MSEPCRPNPLLWYGVIPLALAFLHVRFGYTRKGILPKRGSLVLFNHPSNLDFCFAAGAVWPKRVNFLVAYYWFLSKPLAGLLNSLGCISKYQFSADTVAIRNIKRVIERGGSVAIAPEGTVSGTGTTGYIAPAIGKIIRFLGVPVYAAVTRGSHLCMPKWAQHGRFGRITSECSLIITAEQAKTLSAEELTAIVRSALQHNEYDYALQHKRRFYGKHLAEGSRCLFWLCPVCGKEHSLVEDKNTLVCTECGMTAKFFDGVRLKISTAPQMKSAGEWYDIERRAARDIVSRPFSLTLPVNYLTDGADGVYITIGNGNITFTNEGFLYEGTKNGDMVEEFTPLSSVPTITMDAGKNFELPYDRGVRCFEPADKDSIIKWHMLRNEMH